MTASLTYYDPTGTTLFAVGEDIPSIWNPFNVFDVRQFGAKPTNSGNTTQIQAALDAAEANPSKPVYLPPGTFLTDALFMSGTGVTFFGPGTLKMKNNSTGAAVLILSSADRCLVDGIRVDGSREYTHGGTAAGIQINGSSQRNRIRGTHVFNTLFDPNATADGEGYLIAGDHNILDNISSYDCDYAAVSCPGHYNTFINPMILQTGLTLGASNGVRSFTIDGDYNQLLGGLIDQSLVNYADSLNLGHACFLADPLPYTREFIRIVGTVFKGGSNADNGGNVVKFARWNSIQIQGIKCLNFSSNHTLRFAEACKWISIKDSEFDADVYKENALDPNTDCDYFYAENNKCGLNAAFRESAGFTNMRAKRMEFRRNTVYGNRFATMDIADTALEQCVFDDNHLYGQSDGVSPTSNIFVNTTDVNTMMIGSGKYVYLPNNRMTAQGAGANFTGGSAGKRELLTTIDRTGRNFEMAAAPVDASVSWRLRDRVYSTATPAAGSPDFWLCKVAGVGGTSGQWQAHNL